MLDVINGPEERNMEVVHNYLKAVERLEVEEVGRYLDTSFVQVERPNKL